jgi:GT2 family glycosyltransferase
MRLHFPVKSKTETQSFTALEATLIIVNYNAGDDLHHCLTSLAGDQNSYEVMVVDNASQDSSSHRASTRFPGIQIIYSDSNLGFGGANNLGAQRAHSKYLAFLNPDTVVKPGWLEALIAALEENPQAGLTSSKILQMDNPMRVSGCGNEMHYTGITMGRGMGSDHRHYREIEEVSAISGAAFAMRSDLYTRLRGFDEDFFLYMEDSDLSLRTRLAGYQCLHVPESVVYHNYTLRFGPKKVFYQERNRYLMLLKNLKWPTLLLLLPALLLTEFITWAFVFWRDRGNLTNKLKAYGWIVSNWNLIVQERKAVQTLRRVTDRDLLATCSYRMAYEQVGSGVVVRTASLLFDFLFFIWQKTMLALIRW